MFKKNHKTNIGRKHSKETIEKIKKGHAKYYWDENFEHKINEVKKDNSDKVFIVFHEDNYLEKCKEIINKML